MPPTSSFIPYAALDHPPAILLMGPTASGKTGLAVRLASRFPLEIVSVDSAQIYRHMDIGTAKPSRETLKQVPHHLIDIVDPTQRYSAAHFRHDASAVVAQIHSRGNIPLLTGGTMLYFKALQEGLSALPPADLDTRRAIDTLAQQSGWPALHEELRRIDPDTANRLQPGDAQRIQRALEVFYLTGQPMSALIAESRGSAPAYRMVSIAIEPGQRAVLHQRLAQRFELMLELGLIDELRGLRQRFELTSSLPSMRAVGYRQVWQYLEGDFDLSTLREKATAATRQLAKRQLTWLRRWEGVKRFDCLATDLHEQVEDYVAPLLSQGG